MTKSIDNSYSRHQILPVGIAVCITDWQEVNSSAKKLYVNLYHVSAEWRSVSVGTMRFTYSADGTPQAISYGSSWYYYATNLQGDVIAILDNSGNPVVYYYYDAWGI